MINSIVNYVRQNLRLSRNKSSNKRSGFFFKSILTMTTLTMASVVVANVVAKECPGTPQTVVGAVYCDNQFILWVNGEVIAKDPIDFTPHQAVNVTFDWDGKSNLEYAIQCEDYATESGYEYTESRRPQLGDGALIAEFNDGLGTVTSEKWRVHTVTFGPTDDSLSKGCSADNLERCVVENLGTPQQWISSNFDDSQWDFATVYSAAVAGWGRAPSWSTNTGCCTLTSPLNRSSLGCNTSLSVNECLNPRDEFADSDAQFIWASDLDRDNRVLFRYTATCDNS